MLKYITLIVLLLPVSNAYAHCQIPCGIFDDARVFEELNEHITTIEKSMKSIADKSDIHDVTRWTINKEEHAQKIQDIMSNHFLAQRTKVNEENYIQKLMRIHLITLNAMKAKQSVDLSIIRDLKDSVDGYEKLYFAPHKEEAE